MEEEKQLTAANADSCCETTKIKTHFAKIIVTGSAEKPYYEILYFDPADKIYHIGYSSYCLEYVFKWLSEWFEIIDEISNMDTVSRGVLDQVRWERDVAIGQLEEHGIPFCGVAPDVLKVVRCKDCKHMEMTPDSLRWCNVWNGINGMGDEGFCNYGERNNNG